MTKIFLSHNPFLGETKLTVDGRPIAENTDLAERLRDQMRRWVDHFFELLGKHLNWPESIEVHFVGLTTDYDDLKRARLIFKQRCPEIKMDITLSMDDAITPPLERLIQLEKLFDEAQYGPLQLLKTKDFQGAFRREMDPGYEVYVMATMSSGKSTVINSFLGQDLLPSKNQACTATIVRIHDQDDLPLFEGFRRDAHGQELDLRGQVDRKKLDHWNSDPETAVIELFGDISQVAGHDHAKLVLIDTPGPNNSQNNRHRDVALNAITNKTMPLVLYVLNATQLGVEDDKQLLGLVRDEMSKSGQQARDRFVFLLNLIDRVDFDKEPIKEFVEEAREYLDKNGIIDPLIIPVSALTTKLVRQKKAKLYLTDDEYDELNRLCRKFVKREGRCLLDYMNVSESIRERAEILIKEAKAAGDELELASLHSGIPVVELIIDEYLRKYALVERVVRSKKKVDDFLGQAQGEAQAFEALRDKSQVELDGIRESLQLIHAAIEQGQRNQSLKEELRNKELEISSSTRAEIDSIKANFFGSQSRIVNALAQKGLTVRKAEELVDSTKREVGELLDAASFLLEKSMGRALEEEVARLKNAYREYVSDLFGGHDTGMVEVPAITQLEAVALSFPETSTLVAERAKEVLVGSYKVSEATWYIPWTWLDEREVPMYENRVNLESLAGEFSGALQVKFNEVLSSAEHTIRKQSLEICMTFVDAMSSRLSEELSRLMQKMESATNDSRSRESSIEDANRHLAWIDGFKADLNNVLMLHMEATS